MMISTSTLSPIHIPSTARNGPTTKRLQVMNEEGAEGIAATTMAPRDIPFLLQSASQAVLAKVAESAPTSAGVAF